jgi:hypothetical protein
LKTNSSAGSLDALPTNSEIDLELRPLSYLSFSLYFNYFQEKINVFQLISQKNSIGEGCGLNELLILMKLRTKKHWSSFRSAWAQIFFCYPTVWMNDMSYRLINEAQSINMLKLLQQWMKSPHILKWNGFGKM